MVFQKEDMDCEESRFVANVNSCVGTCVMKPTKLVTTTLESRVEELERIVGPPNPPCVNKDGANLLQRWRFFWVDNVICVCLYL